MVARCFNLVYWYITTKLNLSFSTSIYLRWLAFCLLCLLSNQPVCQSLQTIFLFESMFAVILKLVLLVFLHSMFLLKLLTDVINLQFYCLLNWVNFVSSWIHHLISISESLIHVVLFWPKFIFLASFSKTISESVSFVILLSWVIYLSFQCF